MGSFYTARSYKVSQVNMDRRYGGVMVVVNIDIECYRVKVVRR